MSVLSVCYYIMYLTVLFGCLSVYLVFQYIIFSHFNTADSVLCLRNKLESVYNCFVCVQRQKLFVIINFNSFPGFIKSVLKSNVLLFKCIKKCKCFTIKNTENKNNVLLKLNFHLSRLPLSNPSMATPNIFPPCISS